MKFTPGLGHAFKYGVFLAALQTHSGEFLSELSDFYTLGLVGGTYPAVILNHPLLHSGYARPVICGVGMVGESSFLIIFSCVVAVLLAFDLGLFSKGSGAMKMREALIRSAVWIGTALAFNVALYFLMGPRPALEFLTGYLIELSLSVDNLFVFLILFSQFAVPPAYQHRILFWGILGAIVMRVAMITAGAALVAEFHWILYIFGVFLVWTGIKMLREKSAAEPAGEHKMVGWLRRHLPVAPAAAEHDGRFFVRTGGRLMVTPLFIVLIAVELSDVMFAVDSVPAIFAVTTNTFIILTSNILAILGLRSLYFALAGLAARLKYLKTGLALILLLIGVKILMAGIWPIPILWTLSATALILAVSVIASLRVTRNPAA